MSADPLLSQPDIFTPELPDVPYPGLRPFEKHEWPIFFGRERATQEVIDLLFERSLVVVHGSSGCGKSSLIRAGVLSRLEQEHARSDIAWRTCAMRPGDAPTYNLAREFACLGGAQADAERVQKLRRLIARGPRAISTLAEAVTAGPECRVCLLVDQFEELFRFTRETSREQATLLAAFLVGLVQTRPLGLYTIITMRSEFLGHCAQFTGLAETINRSQYLLPPMERTALLQAIREPANLYDGEVERPLAERLIADAAGAQDMLPLIQHALMLLWKQASTNGDSPRRLGLDLFRKQEGGIVALLSDHADQVMTATAPDPQQQTVVERLFRALTDINAESQGIRRPQSFDQLVAVTGSDREALRRIINAFRAEGVSFLTPYPPEEIRDTTVIDISHEALIRCWRRIADPENGWLQREFQDGLIWRSLLAPAERFEKNPKDVLSPALTEDRRVWLEGRPPAWCERYGGGWQPVTELMKASVDAAAKARRLRVLAPLAGVLLMALLFAGESMYWAMKRSLPLKVLPERWALWVWDPPLPDLVSIPAGSFMMGSDRARDQQEQPVHPVTIAQPFSIGRTEVTFAEWAACVVDGDCNSYPDDEGWGRRTQPVINVTWKNAQTYVKWLSNKIAQNCRLPSEAEWEYSARAGTTTEYALPSLHGSNEIQGKELANCVDCGGKWAGKQTAPVGQFFPNAWGLQDMHGNVFEWVEDCWHDSYLEAPDSGRAWLEGNGSNCSFKVARGGSWNDYKDSARAASRRMISPDFRSNEFGFRAVCSSATQLLVVLKTSKNPYFEAMAGSVKNAATTLRQQVSVKYGDDTTLDETHAGLGQINAIRSFIDQKLEQPQRSAVILAPASSSPDELGELAHLISDLNKHQLPVIIIDTKIQDTTLTSHNAYINAFIGSDNKTGGRLAARLIGEKIGNNKLHVLLLEGVPEQETAQARKQGFLEVAETEYRNWIIIQDLPADWDRLKAKLITKAILDSHGVPAAIFGANDQMAIGAIDALSDHGVAADQWPFIVGFDGTKEARDKISDGRLSATIGQYPDEMAKIAVNWAADLLDNREVPKELLLPVYRISR